MKINQRLLAVKGHYFFKNAASAPILPFLPVIAKDLGYSGTIVGAVLTCVPVLSLVSKPIAGAIADKFRIHKILYIYFLLANLLFFLIFMNLQPLPRDSGVSLRCRDSADLVVTTAKSNDECFVSSLKLLMDNNPLPCQISCDGTGDLIRSLNGRRYDWHNYVNDSTLNVGISFPEVKNDGQIYLKLDYITLNDQTWLEPSCSTPTDWNCQLACQNPTIHDLVTKPAVKDADIFGYPQFWIFAIVVILAKVHEENLGTIGDTITLNILGDRANDLGFQMVWGAVSWGLVSVGTGYMVDSMSRDKPYKDFTYAYYMSATFFLMNLAVGLCLDIKKEDKQGRKNPGLFRSVRKQLFTNPKFLVFLVCVVVCGAGSALVWNYLFWFIEEVAVEDGCSDTTWVKTLDGLALCVHCYLGEIPFFFISGWMLRYFGHANCMSIVLLGFGARFTLYYFLTSAWWILPIETLNGITYAILYSTMMTYANAFAPPGAEATVQGIVSAFFEGIGVCLGSFLGGYFIDTWGIRQLFLIAGLFSVVLAIMHTTFHAFWDNEGSPKKTYDGRQIPPDQFELEHQALTKT
ncbi:Nucleoside H+ symporter [Nesidiocoris tenuis]|uniref:Nucleoside H+ symporter n=1 Tax=Nesidiocoris tenuis TaxID=355587 RepID=A0ABN7AWE8_9HEMI|nr:Nucleoside H+ symporter [Nesidiocoris tenuis]